MATSNPMLYDHLGRQVRTQDLREEMAAPTLTGIRSPWPDGVMSIGLSPESLARILRSASEGDIRDYLALAEEMEEREPHYASVLGTRKRAVSGLDIQVEAASEEDADIALAEEVRALVEAPALRSALDDLLDGLGKGYAVLEILWDQTASRWTPRAYEWRDPRWFLFDQVSGRELRLVDMAQPDGLVLPPFKFITHVPKLKSGLPIRGGLARIAAVPYLCKSYGLADWMRFVEVYGMPVRIGRYGQGASDEDKRILALALANIGSDAAGIIPDSMRIEFVEGGKGGSKGGDPVFAGLVEWLDRQTSKAILGQTMTTDDGSSQAQANVHDNVRGDIQLADARQLEVTLNRDLVRPYVDLNHGIQERYPRMRLVVENPEDVAAMADALAKLIPLGGLEISGADVRERLGFGAPPEGAMLMGLQSAPVNPTDPALNSLALNATQGPPLLSSADLVDELVAEELADWEPVMAPILDPVQQLADECTDFDEFLARLPELLGSMDSTKLVEGLARLGYMARGAGDARD